MKNKGIKLLIVAVGLSLGVGAQTNTITVVTTPVNPSEASVNNGPEMPKMTYADMLAMTANLTDVDLGSMVFVTDLTHAFPEFTACNKAAQTADVFGVWVYEKKSTINQCDYAGSAGVEWLRLRDGISSMPCAACNE